VVFFLVIVVGVRLVILEHQLEEMGEYFFICLITFILLIFSTQETQAENEKKQINCFNMHYFWSKHFNFDYLSSK